MRKIDLKDGMLVKYRNGGIRLVLKRRFIYEDGFMAFTSYNADLTHYLGTEKYDIMEIREKEGFYDFDLGDHWREAETVWTRKETKKMTIAEIQKELGYKIEVVE